MYKIVFFAVPFVITVLVRPGLAFECSVFPGEGPHRIQASGDEMVLRKTPMVLSGIVDTIRLARGEVIKTIDVRFRTVTPGFFIAREDVSIHGRRYGRVFYLSRTDYYRGGGPHETFRFSKGDTIEYLQYRAEGSAFLRMDGVVMKAELGSPEAMSLREIRRPQLELWIKVEDSYGRSLGWTQLENDQFPQPTAGSMRPGPEFLPSR